MRRARRVPRRRDADASARYVSPLSSRAGNLIGRAIDRDRLCPMRDSVDQPPVLRRNSQKTAETPFFYCLSNLVLRTFCLASLCLYCFLSVSQFAPAAHCTLTFHPLDHARSRIGLEPVIDISFHLYPSTISSCLLALNYSTTAFTTQQHA